MSPKTPSGQNRCQTEWPLRGHVRLFTTIVCIDTVTPSERVVRGCRLRLPRVRVEVGDSAVSPLPRWIGPYTVLQTRTDPVTLSEDMNKGPVGRVFPTNGRNSEGVQVGLALWRCWLEPQKHSEHHPDPNTEGDHEFTDVHSVRDCCQLGESKDLSEWLLPTRVYFGLTFLHLFMDWELTCL